VHFIKIQYLRLQDECTHFITSVECILYLSFEQVYSTSDKVSIKIIVSSFP